MRYSDEVICYRNFILLIFLAFERGHTLVQLTPQDLLTYKRVSLAGPRGHVHHENLRRQAGRDRKEVGAD